MSFRPPEFNLLCNLWTCNDTVRPVDGAPAYTDKPCQKYVASRAAWPIKPSWFKGFWLEGHPPVQIRLPHDGPFAGSWPSWKVSCLEVPAGSGQYYRPVWADVQHEGFINEYVLVVCVQCDQSLLSVPPPGATEPVGIAADSCGIVPCQDAQPDCVAGSPWPIIPPTPPGTDFTDSMFDVGLTELSSHIADTGQTWTENTAGMRIQASGLDLEAYDSAAGVIYGQADYVGRVDGTMSSLFATNSDVTNPTSVGILFKMVDFNNYNLLWVITDGAGGFVLEIRERVAGVESTLATSGSFSLNDNSPYVLFCVIAGDSLACRISDGSTDIGTVSTTTSTFTGQTNIGVVMIDDTVGGTWVIQNLHFGP